MGRSGAIKKGWMRRVKPRPLLHENEEFHRLSALQSILLHAGLAVRSAKEPHSRIVLHINDLLAMYDLVHAPMETIRARPGRKRDEKTADQVRSAAIWVLNELTSRPKREEKRLKAIAVEVAAPTRRLLLGSCQGNTRRIAQRVLTGARVDKIGGSLAAFTAA